MSNISKNSTTFKDCVAKLDLLKVKSPVVHAAKRVVMNDTWARKDFTEAVGQQFRGELSRAIERASAQAAARTATVGPMHAATQAQRTGASARITETEVPEGRYALDGTGANETVFYVVKWWDGRNGRMFSVYNQVTDNETKVEFRAALNVLRRIADAGALAASQRYGREIGACGVCGRTLTNDESRAAGIGPVCASKF